MARNEQVRSPQLDPLRVHAQVQAEGGRALPGRSHARPDRRLAEGLEDLREIRVLLRDFPRPVRGGLRQPRPAAPAVQGAAGVRVGVAGRGEPAGVAVRAGAGLLEANFWYEAEFDSSRRSSGPTSTSWRGCGSSRPRSRRSRWSTSTWRAASTSAAPRSTSRAGAPWPTW